MASKKFTVEPTAWAAWQHIEKQVRIWCFRKWHDPMSAEDVVQAGAIEFVRRYKAGYIEQPENWRFQAAKCSCMDAAKSLGQGYWKRSDTKTPEPEFVGIDAYIETLPDLQAQAKDQDERLEHALQIIKSAGDGKLAKAFNLLLAGNTQREAAALTKMSATRLSEKLAAVGEKISGKRRVRKSNKTKQFTATVLTLNISAY